MIGDPDCYATSGQGGHLACPTAPEPPIERKRQSKKLSNRRGRTCAQWFEPPRRGQKIYCSKHCVTAKAPAVYRFICPDGRSCVGSRLKIKNRKRDGIGPQNPWLRKALKRHPPEAFRFERTATAAKFPRPLERKRPLRFQRGGRLVSRPCERSENAYAVSP